MKRCSTSTAIRETRIKTLVRCPFVHVGLAVIKRRASQAALEAKNLLAMRETQETQFHPWVRKIPWRRKWQPSPVFCLENSLDRGALWTIVRRAAESDMTQRVTVSCLLKKRG